MANCEGKPGIIDQTKADQKGIRKLAVFSRGRTYLPDSLGIMRLASGSVRRESPRLGIGSSGVEFRTSTIGPESFHQAPQIPLFEAPSISRE